MPALLAMLLSAAGAADEPVQFNRDIRPILSDACFQCHGPDKAKRKADLRLDTEEGTFADRGGHKVVVPGDPARSELIRRVTADDVAERMPPAKAARKLTPREIDLLRRWVGQGAKWEKHWSLIPPRRPDLPDVKDRAWIRNGIDAFILARLQAEGLRPSPEADRVTLIRRVSLDLTGLPPTPAEVDAFLADRSPDAYERVVDRLLASPRYGERMARPWLDAARYADTNGYQNDGDRIMWRWRDWVIEAFNRNLPFDQFTVEQLAGDLLPGATFEQRLATGFNRNHRGNGEGGIIPEEYAVEYVVDRVETTATVWLGLTLGCARCHDHKYDPFSQRDFYRVFAFFNNVPERGRAVKYGNSPPLMRAPTRQQQEQLAALDRRLAAAEADFARLEPEIAAAQAAWEQTAKADPARWAPSAGLAAHLPLDGEGTAKFVDGAAAYIPGPLGKAGEFDGKRFLDAGNLGDFGFDDKLTLTAWVYPKGDGAIVSRMADIDPFEGYELHLENGRLQLNLSKRWLDDALRAETAEPLAPGRWHHVVASYDGSRWATGVRLYVDGRPQKLHILLDELNQDFRTAQPLRVGARGTGRRLRGAVADVRLYNRVLAPDEITWLADADPIASLIAIPPANRTPVQAGKLRACFLERHAREHVRQARQRVADLRRQRERLVESFPTTMVMEEMPAPRPTFVLIRGQYDRRGERVTADVPASLPPLPPSPLPLSPAAGERGRGEGALPNRLAFARWLVDPGHPLTARVAVNRTWQLCFGTGLVKTVDDLGSQGDSPSHPELLDWLATEFVRTGWDVKALHRLLVTSATYRQSSRLTPELLQRDPDNRLLARGPRFRLSAEVLRDQALAASGLLVERLGGPSVKPYQPVGLWKELHGTEGYVQDHGPDLYRRSLYTFWKRTVAPPMLMTFDAAGRETCVVRETRTNTPLQALTLMNDVTFVEAARVLAQRVMREGGTTPEERITLAFRLATARRPTAAELQVLVAGFHRHLADYRRDARAAAKLVSAGESPRDSRLDVAELAAYTAVAGLILNLDETVTKE